MLTAAEYREKNRELLTEYEQKARSWLANLGEKELSEQIPFFRDGVTCPEVWFKENNTFRPLFILKEVSLGINKVCELPQFLEKWGHKKQFEFVENPFDDIKVGTFPQWRRIARLAKGFEEAHYGVSNNKYSTCDLSYVKGDEIYSGDIAGYKDKAYCIRTANKNYNDIINKIAVLEIKKLGAGQTVTSQLSLRTQFYAEHVKPFEELLCRQINLIDPTVIICLGRENGNCISNYLENIRNNTNNRMWIDGYHHTRSSNVHFYEEPLQTYRDLLNNQK